jgi:hypothetical protein
MALNTYTIGAGGTGVRTYNAVTNGDTAPVDSQLGTFLHVRNGNAGACTVTIVDASLTPAGNASANKTVVVPATTGDEMILLPYTAGALATGLVTVNYSLTATVTAAVLRA